MIVDNSPRHKVTMSGVTDTASFQMEASEEGFAILSNDCLLYTSPSPRDRQKSRMPSSA